MASVTVWEPKRKIGMVNEKLMERGHDSMIEIFAVLGADPGASRREKRRDVRRLVSETYSPPRVTEMLRHMSNHKLMPGMEFDLTTTDPDDGMPWDLSFEEERSRFTRRCDGRSPYSS